MQRMALAQLLANGVCVALLMGLYIALSNLKDNVGRQESNLLRARNRLERLEAVYLQKRRSEAVMQSLESNAGFGDVVGLEGRVKRLEIRVANAHELLIGFIYTRAPPAVRHYYVYPSSLVDELTALDQESDRLTQHIRENLFVYPPLPILQTTLLARDTSRGEVGAVLRHIFRDKKNGLFIECGALDGLTMSNTFYFERLLGWTGVLIEPEPNSFNELLQRKRNVLSIPTCLSRSRHPQLVPFTFGWHAYSRIDTLTPMSEHTNNVLCMPFFAILKAINRTDIDLFSLDIEGHELDVLRTIPWEEVDIKVLIVEHFNIAEGQQALEDFMTSKGYAVFPSTAEERMKGQWAEFDDIFVKKDVGLNES
ncbi:uncharacterized protein LOC135944138 [Cloeon dipterum]|uniref:uncharacterized protein LOC135944138 n=1 Tax=Cloeon dipterum TaxID=197152 RepID=UPI00321F92D1